MNVDCRGILVQLVPQVTQDQQVIEVMSASLVNPVGQVSLVYQVMQETLDQPVHRGFVDP